MSRLRSIVVRLSRRILAIRIDRWIASAWILGAVGAYVGCILYYDYTTYYGGQVAEAALNGDFKVIDDYREADAEALNLLSVLDTVAALRDHGAMDDWSFDRSRGDGPLVLRHGKRGLPVVSVSEAMRFPGRDRRNEHHIASASISFEGPVPIRPVTHEDWRGVVEKGRVVVSIPTDKPRSCRTAMFAIRAYPSIVANFEVADPSRGDGLREDVWLPLDPNRSKALDRLCGTQFAGGVLSFDTPEPEFLGSRQTLRFRLLPPDERSSMALPVEAAHR